MTLPPSRAPAATVNAVLSSLRLTPYGPSQFEGTCNAMNWGGMVMLTAAKHAAP